MRCGRRRCRWAAEKTEQDALDDVGFDVTSLQVLDPRQDAGRFGRHTGFNDGALARVASALLAGKCSRCSVGGSRFLHVFWLPLSTRVAGAGRSRGKALRAHIMPIVCDDEMTGNVRAPAGIQSLEREIACVHRCEAYLRARVDFRMLPAGEQGERVKKNETRRESPALPTGRLAHDSTLRESAAAAASALIAPGEAEVDRTYARPAGRGAGKPDNGDTVAADTASLVALKQRCLAFGINATTAELFTAGLHLLTQQTETALEVAVLQSLRADRSFTKRRSPR